MHPNPQLERIIARESYAAILAILTPRELAVVALRLDGLDFKHAAELLGLTQQTGFERMRWARKRVLNTFPHTQTLVDAP